MRAVRGVPSFRSQRVAKVVMAEIARASTKGFRVIEESIQTNHVHLVVEADDAAAFSLGMQRLASRIAMAVNALVARHGRVWRERYHRRDLATPRQFRNALVYVVMNHRKHAPPGDKEARGRALDRFSSAIWIDDWKDAAFRDFVREQRIRAGPRPTALPETWIARVGWKRHGAIDPREAPRSPG
jgi:putative transposase